MRIRNKIVERRLLYSASGGSFKEFVVCVGDLREIKAGEVDFKFDIGSAICRVEFFGLTDDVIDVHGIDSLHALTLALDIDGFLRNLSKKYEFYWPTGEPYFED